MYNITITIWVNWKEGLQLMTSFLFPNEKICTMSCTMFYSSCACQQVSGKYRERDSTCSFPHLQLPVFTLNKCKPESIKLLSGWATWEDGVWGEKKCWICSTLDHVIKETPQRWLLHHRGCLTQRQHACCSGLWPVSERGVLLQAQPQEGTQDLGNGRGVWESPNWLLSLHRPQRRHLNTC